MDDKKIANLIDALVDLLDGDTEGEEGEMLSITTFDTDDPLAEGVKPIAVVSAVFRLADRYDLDEDELGFAIARLQFEFGMITGTVPISNDVFEMFTHEDESEKEE